MLPVTSSSTAGRRRPASHTSVARQIKEQRRGYARAVLQGLARTHRGRPIDHVHRVLRDSLTPLGVRPRPATLRQLAADISAGRPVALN